MYCPNCGNEIKNNSAKFCNSCGCNILQNNSPKKSKYKIYIIISIVFIFLLIICSLSYYFINSQNEQSIKKTVIKDKSQNFTSKIITKNENKSEKETRLLNEIKDLQKLYDYILANNTIISLDGESYLNLKEYKNLITEVENRISKDNQFYQKYLTYKKTNSTQYNKCNDICGNSWQDCQGGMTCVSNIDYNNSIKVIGLVYKDIENMVSPETFKTLKAEQIEWIKTTQNFENKIINDDNEGITTGTMFPSLMNEEKIRWQEFRTKLLLILLTNL